MSGLHKDCFIDNPSTNFFFLKLINNEYLNLTQLRINLGGKHRNSTTPRSPKCLTKRLNSILIYRYRCILYKSVEAKAHREVPILRNITLSGPRAIKA